MVSRGVGLTAAPDYAGPPSPSPAPTPQVTRFHPPYGRKEQVGKRKKVASVMFTGAAATAMVGAAVQPAAAQASNWTITPGGGITGTNNTPALLAVDTDLGFPVSLTCPSGTVTASGSVVNATTGTPAASNPVDLGNINTATFGTAAQPCSLFGLGVVATLDHGIDIGAAGFPSNGVTPGELFKGSAPGTIEATITGVNGFSCNMHVTGTKVPGSYNNNTGILAVNPSVTRTLHIDAVTGCSVGGVDLFGVSNAAGFQANFTVNPRQTISHT
jgi:hypothetical protein